MSKILHTVNITTDAGFDIGSGLGSAGITFWTNYNGFKCKNFIVQKTHFPSNNEAELFGLLMGIEKFNIMAFGRMFEVTPQTVNIYCDNYTALSTIVVIHDDIDLKHRFSSATTKEETVTHAVDTFFNTLAVFEHTHAVVLRADRDREPIVHHLCEKLYDAFEFLVSANGIEVDGISHVKGHILSTTTLSARRIESNRQIFEGKHDRIEVVDVRRFIEGRYDSKKLPVPFIRTALSPIELYSNCVADALASANIGEIQKFKTVLNVGDAEEEQHRNDLHGLHLRMVILRMLHVAEPPGFVFNKTVKNVEEVSEYRFGKRTISYIEKTYLKEYNLDKKRCVYTKLY